MDYLVHIKQNHKSRLCKFHINMLKEYNTRKEIFMFAQTVKPEEDDCIVTYTSEQTKTSHDIKLSSTLKVEEKTIMEALFTEYADVFSDKPGRTTESEFIIDTGDAKPIMSRPYRLRHTMKSEVEKEVHILLDQGIIRESTSEWCSPIVVRQKFKDGKLAGV